MFNYYQPTNIHFGIDRTDEIGTIAKKYGDRCLLVTMDDAPLQKLYKRVIDSLEDEGISVFHFDQVKSDPSVNMIDEGIEMARENKVEFVLAVGGGSSIDAAKSIAFKARNNFSWDDIFEKFDSHTEMYPAEDNSLPLLSIPTTSGTGSHVTQAAVVSKGEEKITFYHPDLFSKEAIVDPSLMVTLPVRMTAATGFDTFAHAFESFVNGQGSFYSKNDSIEAMKLVIEYLPKTINDPSNIEYRTKLALADTLGGYALSNAGADTPHPLSEIIGGISNIPHGEGLAIVYPSYVKNSIETRREGFDKVAKLFGEQYTAEDLSKLITDFLKEINLNKKLSDYNVSDEEFEKIKGHPVFGVLPFGSKEYFINILNESK